MARATKVKYMSLWLDDWTGGTLYMTPAEEGIYLRLCMYLYTNPGMPTDHSRLARICRVSDDEFTALWPAVQDKFYERRGKLFSTRVSREVEKAKEKSRKRASAGKKGGKATANAAANALATSKHTQSIDIYTTPAVSPPTLQEVKAAGDQVGVPPAVCEEFHGFWSANGWKLTGGLSMLGDWRRRLKDRAVYAAENKAKLAKIASTTTAPRELT